MIGVPTGLSAALRAAIIVTATAAFFVIATRHIDLPGLYTTKPCSTHQRPRSMPTVAFKLALIKPGTQGRLRDLWWTFTMIGDGRESPLTGKPFRNRVGFLTHRLVGA